MTLGTPPLKTTTFEQPPLRPHDSTYGDCRRRLYSPERITEVAPRPESKESYWQRSHGHRPRRYA